MRQVREVLRLRFVGGVSTREIARRIGVAASTVRATVKRFQAAGLSWPAADLGLVKNLDCHLRCACSGFLSNARPECAFLDEKR
jgi:transposase-like protein